MRTIPKEESLDIEFKSDLKCYPDHDLIEEIVGMTNTAGGCLFLGVEDDGTITGVHKKHRDPIGVTALIANSTVPPIAVRAEIITEEDKDVLKIEVPRSRGVMVLLTAGNNDCVHFVHSFSLYSLVVKAGPYGGHFRRPHHAARIV